MNLRARIHRVLCAAFVLSAGVTWSLGYIPPELRAHAGVAFRMGLTALMLGAWAMSQRATVAEHRWTLASGVLARLLVAPIAIDQSHDVQRYLWDGAVFAAGLDPYQLAPAAPEVSGLRSIWPTPPEHAAYATIYPPGAIFLFGLATALGPAWAPWCWKGIVVVASLGLLWLGAQALGLAGRQRHLPLLALSPLLLMETATGAHLDLVAALALAGAVALALRDRDVKAGLMLGLGTLFKLLPMLAVLALVRRTSSVRARRMGVAAASAVLVGYAVALMLELHPLGSLPVFFAKWRFGAPLFALLASLLGDNGALRVAPPFMIVPLALAWRASLWRWEQALPFLVATPLLVSPVVFPWYLAPLVPLVALAPNAFMVGWLSALPLASEATERFEATGVWKPASWPVWVVGCAWVIGAVIDMKRSRRPQGPMAMKDCSSHRISVIMPVLNEAARIDRALAELAAMPGLHEIIAADGGSDDGTVERAQAHPQVRLVQASRGRARQMNAGAQLASGDVLLFLHADVRLPERADRWVEAAFHDEAVLGGAFRTWTMDDEARGRFWEPLLHLADLRSRYTTLPYGDQAIFVRASAFHALGGYAEVELMEDLDLSRRLRRVGRLVTVPAEVTVSGRRFLARPFFYFTVMNLFPVLYRLGVPPKVLSNWYGHIR